MASTNCRVPSDPTSLFLQRIFDGALRASLSAMAVGCGGDDWPQRGEGFEPVSCEPLADLTPGAPADYVALRDAWGSGGTLTQLAAVGTPCATATDRPRCEAALASTEGLIRNNVGVDALVVRYVAMTRGDEVGKYDTPDALRGFLGTIDTPNEAVLMARIAGYTIDCAHFDRAAVRVREEGGYEVVGTKLTKICAPIETTKFLLSVASDGAVAVVDRSVYDRESSCVGRRPAGLSVTAIDAHGAPTIGAFFARIAQLEAASIRAFRVLARELAALGAPATLIARARAAACDEVRHARITGRLARHFGVTPPPFRIAPQPLRSAPALAHDNAVEGCVRETFGALFGCFQAAHAADPRVRVCMRAIAADETRHASLAWDVATWLDARLSVSERAAIARARAEAASALADELARTPSDPALEALAGVPSRAEAARLLTALDASLWSARDAA